MSSLWEELQQEVSKRLSKSGPILQNAGKDRSSYLMDPTKNYQNPTDEELKRTEAEKDAIGPPMVGPISIDPTDYFTPGGLAKAGTALLKGTASLKGAALVGAFRAVNSSALSRRTVEGISDLVKWSNKDLERGIPQQQGELPYLHALLTSKLTNKELSKYGTPEFVMDPWLVSTQHYPGDPPYGLTPMTTNKLAYSDQANSIRNATKSLNLLRESRSFVEQQLQDMANTPRELVKSVEILKSMEDKYKNIILREGTLVEDFLRTKNEGKTLFHTNDVSNLQDDISRAADTLSESLANYNIDSSIVAKKSLQQIAAIVKSRDDEILKTLKKSQKVKEDIISKRTGELLNSQRDPNNDMFVQLETPLDLSHETDILNHCLGAVGRDNDRYIPALDTITGKPNQKYHTSGTSFEVYSKRMDSGKSHFYSYRPKGVPEVTLEVGNKNAWGGNLTKPYIKQAYSKEDAPLNKAQIKAVSEFADRKNFQFDPERWSEQ